MLLEEFDPTMRAVINPDAIHSKIDGFPETIVSVFSYHLFSRLVELLKGEVIAYTKDVDGEWPVYRVNYKGKVLAFGKARLGGPACTGYFEDLLAMGGKRIILTGNCGVLDKTIEDCAIIIPLAAIRDEGTSYHYAPPSDIIKVNRKYAEEFKRICNEQGYPTVEGTTWTTDVFYRETPKRLRLVKCRVQFASKWNALPCRRCVIFGVRNFFNTFMQGIILILTTGISAVLTVMSGWMIKKRSPCWLLSLPPRSADIS